MSTGKLFFEVAASLDGFIAPEGMDLAHVNDPEFKQWMSQWTKLQNWVFQQQFFRKNLKLGDGGETGRDNRMLEETFNRTGVSIMGKRMFDGGEHAWPEEAPFHTPVFVLTHQVRPAWERPGGTTFYFVNDGIDAALAQAREACGDRDIRVAGGANVIQQYLRAGLIDEFDLAISPMLMGAGLRLFEGLDSSAIGLQIKDAVNSPRVTHVTY